MDITVTQEGPVAVITWNAGENRINVDSLGRLNEILDELDTIEGPLAIVLTGTGKFFCNGLDIERFAGVAENYRVAIEMLNTFIGRLLVYPAYTVAALNGHTFAGGALISCAFDYRVMRADRGYWCMNEIEIGMQLDAKLWSILEHRLPRPAAIVAATTGHRFSGQDAHARGIVEAVASEGELLGHAIGVADRYATLDRRILGVHKRLVHGAQAELLGYSQ